MKTCLACALTIAAIAATAAAQPPHAWKLDRPVVSNYWPAKGDPSTKVVIRGQNFAPDTAVVWGGTPIAGAHVAANEISFTVPKDAKSGAIMLRHGGHDLAVGGFEVAHYDGADLKRADADRQHAAEATWKDRQKIVAKDRAARDAALAKQEHDLEASRDQRRTQEVTEIRTKWQQPALADPDVEAELTLHGQRAAELDRMDRLATARNDGKLVVRVQVAIAKENDRHTQRMATIQAAFKK